VSDRPNIVLTGFMGTGKTTVGRELARRLGYRFVDTDQIIEQRHGPIADIFAKKGEKAFRSIERTVAAELADVDGLVVATGGRMMLDDSNASSLGRSGHVICLVASSDTIRRRVTADDSGVIRPLLDGDDARNRIEELLESREAGYRRFPQVDTNGRSVQEVADAVIALIPGPMAW
jgi:shikimate kinase